MATYKLPAINEVPMISDEQFLEIIDSLFEPNDMLHAMIEGAEDREVFLKLTEYKSYEELIDAVKEYIEDIAMGERPSEGYEVLDQILQAHPRLGAKKVESAQSQAEQAQLNQGGEEEEKKLAELNEDYEKQFPGLRYVVFVNGRSREEIMKDMRKRIDGDDEQLERETALQAMADIAKDRARKLQQA